MTAAHRELMLREPLLEDGTAATGHKAYDALPRAIKDGYTLEEWLWVGDTEKTFLVQRETEPDF